MAFTTVHDTNDVKIYRKDFVKEYTTHNQFAKYFGSGHSNVIEVNRDLSTKKGGSMLTSLVPNLAADDGVTGNSQLEGNETALDNYGQEVEIETYRKAVATTNREKQRTVIDLMKAGRGVLLNWKLDLIKNHCIRELHKIRTASGNGNTSQGIDYATADATSRDAWIAANSDRILIGDGSVGSYTDHSADLLLITSAMTLDGATVSTMKDKVEAADDTRIAPIKVKEDDNEEWFVCFVNPETHRDLWNDPVVRADHREAMNRGIKNPLFRGGDIITDGIIVRKIQGMGNLGAVGAASAVIAPYFLCGQTALTVAYAMDAKFTTEVRDYGFVHGVAVECDYNVRKCTWATNAGETTFKDFGIATGYVAAAAD